MRRALPGRQRRLGPLRRSGRHADGRHGDRRDGRMGGQRQQRQHRRRRSAPPTPATPCSSGPGRPSPSCSARSPAGDLLRRQHDDADAGLHPGRRRGAAPRRHAWSARGSTTTPTSRRGGWPATPAGAEHVLAPFDPATGRLDPAAVIELIDERDSVGRRHRRVEPARHDPGPRRRSWPPPTTPGPGCSSTPSTWPPHRRDRRRARSAATCSSRARTSGTGRTPACCAPTRRAARRAAGGQGAAGPRPWPAAVGDRHAELRGASPPSTPPRDSCSRRTSTRLAAAEAAVFAPAARGTELDRAGCASGGHRRWRIGRRRSPSPSRAGRPSEVAAELAAVRIATWAGHSYAVEAVDQLGLAERGGVVRAGVVAYVEPRGVSPPARGGGADRRGLSTGAQDRRRRRCGPSRRRRASGMTSTRRSSRRPGSACWRR